MNSKTALKLLKELVAAETYETIMDNLAGTTVYFPFKTEYTYLEERNLCIKDDFYSGNYEIAELAQKYGLSISRIYKIIQSK